MPHDDTSHYEDLSEGAHPNTAEGTISVDHLHAGKISWEDPTKLQPVNHADAQYQDYLEDILQNGTESADRTGVGTRKVVGRQLRFDLTEGFPLLAVRPIWAFGACREMMWFVRGRTNIWHLLQDDVGIWTGNAYANYKECLQDAPVEPLSKKKFEVAIRSCDNPAHIEDHYESFASMWGEMGQIYGARWRDAGGFDQLGNLLEQLEENPESRRLKVSAWKPAYHMTGAPKEHKAELPPCHTGFQVVTETMPLSERQEWARDSSIRVRRRDEEILDAVGVPRHRLNLIWSQRSVDSILGLPFNIAGYGLLARMLADQSGMALGDLVFQGGDCHIYKNHIEAAEELVRRSPPSQRPKIELPDAASLRLYRADDIEITRYDPCQKLDCDVPMAT